MRKGGEGDGWRGEGGGGGGRGGIVGDCGRELLQSVKGWGKVSLRLGR